MKNVILVVLAFISLCTFAQSTPTPPKTPPVHTTTSTKTSSSYSYSMSDDNDTSHSSSISVTKSDDSYKFRASFHKSKTEKVKQLIKDRLGKENLTVNGNTYQWNKNKNGDEVFECRLTKGHVRIYITKDDVSASFYNKIVALGEELKYAITGSRSRNHAQGRAEHAKRDLERAQRDLERAKRDLERAKQNLERSKNRKN